MSDYNKYRASWIDFETGIYCRSDLFDSKEEALEWANEHLIEPEPQTLLIRIEPKTCFYYNKSYEDSKEGRDGCCTCIECYIGGHCPIAVDRMTEEEKIFYSVKKEEKKMEKETNVIKEYDENGNLIHFKTSNGYEWWKKYDENGNETYFKDSDGYEELKKYDENGNIIHYKNYDGYESWKEYDENGNMIYYKNSNGYEWWDEKYKKSKEEKKMEMTTNEALLNLTLLEQSILNRGMIKASCTAEHTPNSEGRRRLKHYHFYEIQEKYNYKYYISDLTFDQQLLSLVKFKSHILDFYTTLNTKTREEVETTFNITDKYNAAVKELTEAKKKNKELEKENQELKEQLASASNNTRELMEAKKKNLELEKSNQELSSKLKEKEDATCTIIKQLTDIRADIQKVSNMVKEHEKEENTRKPKNPVIDINNIPDLPLYVLDKSPRFIPVIGDVDLLKGPNSIVVLRCTSEGKIISANIGILTAPIGDIFAIKVKNLPYLGCNFGNIRASKTDTKYTMLVSGSNGISFTTWLK